jgi:cell division protein FtsQ
VLSQYARLEVSRVHVAQEVHLAEDGSVTLVVGSKGLSLKLGKGPWRTKLLMAVRVLGKLGARADVPEVVFLDNEEHPERVVVRMR